MPRNWGDRFRRLHAVLRKPNPEMHKTCGRLSTFMYKKDPLFYKNVIPHKKPDQKNVNGKHLFFRRFEGKNPGVLREACVANGKRA
jgi:hypothetical protein